MQMPFFLFSLFVKQNISWWQAFTGTAWSYTCIKHRADFDSSAFFNGCLFPPAHTCDPASDGTWLQKTETHLPLKSASKYSKQEIWMSPALAISRWPNTSILSSWTTASLILPAFVCTRYRQQLVHTCLLAEFRYCKESVWLCTRFWHMVLAAHKDESLWTVCIGLWLLQLSFQLEFC